MSQTETELPTTANRRTPMDHLRSKKKPRLAKVRIPTDSEIGDAYEEAKSSRDLARFVLEAASEEQRVKLRGDLDQAEALYQEAKAAVVEASTEFIFRAVGRVKYDKLLRENQKTTKQTEEDDKNEVPAEERVTWDPDRFPPALVAESIVEPKLTHADIEEMWSSEDWSTAELATLFGSAMQANNERHIITLGKD